MNIPKAIKLFTDLRDHNAICYDPDTKDAIKLGIEALKRIKRLRDKRFPVMGEELPGETKGE